jgi:hypothetical protein
MNSKVCGGAESMVRHRQLWRILEMDDEQPVEVLLAENGDPILQQYGEEGFIDCAFRIVNHVSSDEEHKFHLAASHDGESVGFDVVIVKGIRGAFDGEMDLIPDHVYYDGVRFLRSGPESDRLINVLAALYSSPANGNRMVDAFSFTAIALHHDDVDIESEPITIKLFGNDGDDIVEEDYFESFFNLDLSSGLVFWNEKDPDYRDPLIRGLSAVESSSS